MSKQDFMKSQVCVLRVNIHCDGCKHKVRKLLQKVDGVYATSIDSEQGKVTVTGNVDPNTLIHKLSKSGKHAELWSTPKGGVGGGSNNLLNINQFKNMQLDFGKSGKGNKIPQPMIKAQQYPKGFSKDLKVPSHFKEMKKDHKNDKYDDEEDFDDEDDGSSFDDDEYDDDEFDEDDFENGFGIPQKAPDKMTMPQMGNNGHGPRGPNGMLNGPNGPFMMNGPNGPFMLNGQNGGGFNVGKGQKNGGSFEIPSQVKSKGMENVGKKGKKGEKGDGENAKGGKEIVRSKSGRWLFGGGDKSEKTKVVVNDGAKLKKGSDDKSSKSGRWLFGGGKKGEKKESGGEKVKGMKKKQDIKDFEWPIKGGKTGGDYDKGGKKGKNNASLGMKGGAKNDNGKKKNNSQHGLDEINVNGGGDLSRNMGQMGLMGNIGSMGNMGRVGQMGGYPQMGSIPAVQGLPANTMNPGAYYQGMAQPGNPYNNQQYMAMMMNQQRPNGNGMYHPMMYARPQPPMGYGPMMPPPPSQDNFTHIFSDENTDSCSIM